MNARMSAGNFTPDALREAVKKAHCYGVKVYLTLNTLVTDRELPAFLQAAEEAADAGVDALIIADAGGAAMVHRTIPELELHASTQMSGHNAAMGRKLQALGYSRMVAAREISEENLRMLLRESPIETELFIHGALCVCHSGQCLFSSMIGGRSGNRGECAQPCRLPYSGTRRTGERYPLSLKDLSLAAHVPTLIELGVSSLKIEGRMKSPEYVRDTARIWRRLLDERRPAEPREMRALAEAFSRNGFTDGYFTGKIHHSMLGVRRDADKDASRNLEPFAGLNRKIALRVCLTAKRDEPIRLSLSDGTGTVTIAGDVPETARTSPMTGADMLRSVTRFGGTCYEAGETIAQVEDGLMVPVSRLNDLRRRAVEALILFHAPGTRTVLPAGETRRPTGKRSECKTARFYAAEQITPAARAYFDRIYLPLRSYRPIADGVVLPPVIFDRDTEGIAEQLRDVAGQGATHAIVGNPGHFALVRESGLHPVGDFRLNVTNRESAALWESLGVEEQILSPELTLPQVRDVGGNTAAIVYGRIPLMVLEKCVISEVADCETCQSGQAALTDRRGVVFPVLREWDHRNVVYNSVPTSMSDRADVLLRAGVTAWHFLFSTETPDEVDRVVEAFGKGIPLGGAVRRIAN